MEQPQRVLQIKDLNTITLSRSLRSLLLSVAQLLPPNSNLTSVLSVTAVHPSDVPIYSHHISTKLLFTQGLTLPCLPDELPGCFGNSAV